MTPTLVYRVEDVVGAGPYTFEEDGEFIQRVKEMPFLESHNHDGMHPTPALDAFPILPPSKVGWFCGFNSIYQLLRWFSHAERVALKEHGFSCNVYCVEASPATLLSGKSQCMFFRPACEIISTIELDEIHLTQSPTLLNSSSE